MLLRQLFAIRFDDKGLHSLYSSGYQYSKVIILSSEVIIPSKPNMKIILFVFAWLTYDGQSFHSLA